MILHRSSLWTPFPSARAELPDAQRAEHHVRREEILKRKGLVKDAPKGGRPEYDDKLSSYSDRAANFGRSA